MSSSFTCTALSAPIDNALRSASFASSGPTVSTVTSAPSFAAAIRNACSTPYSSNSERSPSTESRSVVRSSAKRRSPVASGTYFTQTTILKLTACLLNWY